MGSDPKSEPTATSGQNMWAQGEVLVPPWFHSERSLVRSQEEPGASQVSRRRAGQGGCGGSGPGYQAQGAGARRRWMLDEEDQIDFTMV